MQRILLVLIALAFAAPTAEAAQRDTTRGQAANRTTQQAAKPTQAQPPRQQATRQRTAARHSPRPGDVRTSRSSVVVRGASAATVSRQPAATRRSSVSGWQRGLPVANNAQRECPAGTLATLARGHEDVVRCMPL